MEELSYRWPPGLRVNRTNYTHEQLHSFTATTVHVERDLPY
jgi:hypothetical protein